MRQADGPPTLALRRIPRMFGISGLRRNQEDSVGTGEDRSQMSGMQRGRDPRESEPAPKIVLRMRPLPEVQIRSLEQSRAAAVSLMRRDLHGGKGIEENRHDLAVRQQGMRLQSSRANRRAT